MGTILAYHGKISRYNKKLKEDDHWWVGYCFIFPKKSLKPIITMLGYFDDSYQLRLRINLTSD
ncbi:hypothetical protein [Halarsenatibacter silvermanii]|uniref:hypothetical protein n=1 Tax=Halarsenatibacter silvermanii TaxID=321763 RepID=UPI00117B1BFD|nr:hypothetical protein [Halarsenatibacter silvermanii]